MAPRTRSERANRKHDGHAWQRIRAQVIAEEDVCGLCGHPVDKTLRWPHRWSPTVDLKVALANGGSWRDRANLQLAHLRCNSSAGDKTRTRQPFPTTRRW